MIGFLLFPPAFKLKFCAVHTSETIENHGRALGKLYGRLSAVFCCVLGINSG